MTAPRTGLSAAFCGSRRTFFSGYLSFFERATSAPERRDPFVATVPRSLMGPLVVVIASSTAEREELNCRKELQPDPQLLVDLGQDSSSRSVDWIRGIHTTIGNQEVKMFDNSCCITAVSSY